MLVARAGGQVSRSCVCRHYMDVLALNLVLAVASVRVGAVRLAALARSLRCGGIGRKGGR